VQYEFNLFNVTNTTSLDVPQDQTQIRQNDACSTIANGQKYGNCQEDYVNYGQIATTNNPADQQSALANLDQKPSNYASGTGKATTIPITANGANFGSVTGTIGGNRAITMGLHLIF
jgi:hypothetical protein